MILGADVYGLTLQARLVRGLAKAPVAQNTVFGSILTGVADPQDPSTDSSAAKAYHTVTEQSLDKSLSILGNRRITNLQKTLAGRRVL